MRENPELIHSDTESLRDYFSQFGEVVECTVMRDNATGRSRGFGFLTFKDAKTVNIVMVKEHFLDGKIVSTAQGRAAKVEGECRCGRVGADFLSTRLTPRERFRVTSKRKLARYLWAE